jgi:hypothetical protein
LKEFEESISIISKTKNERLFDYWNTGEVHSIF